MPSKAKTITIALFAIILIIGIITVISHISFLDKKIDVEEQAMHGLGNSLDIALHQVNDLASEVSRLKENRPASAITPSTSVTKVPFIGEEKEITQKPFKISCFSPAGKQIYLAMADGVDSMEGASFINVNKVGAKDDDLEQFITFPNGIYCITGLRGEK